VRNLVLAAALGLLSLFAAPGRADDDIRGQLADAVMDGALHVAIALDDGRAPLGYGYALETSGRPVLALEASARAGKITAFCARVPAGGFVLRGAGLRPDIRIEEIEIGDDGSVRAARYRGDGGWSRFVLGLASGLAKKALARLRFRTEIAALMRGDLLVPAEEPKKPAAPPATTAPSPAPEASAPPSPSRSDAFLALVDHVRVEDSTVTAFGARPLAFGDALHLTTGSGAPLRVRIDEAVYRPETKTGVSAYRVTGGLDGTFAGGAMRWGTDRLTFTGGSVEGARFLVEDGFASANEVAASRLALDLSSGRFELPTGIRVDVAAPSRFAARDVAITAAGTRALVDLDLRGETGEIAREGSRLTLASAHVTTSGLKISQGRVDGDVALAFDYRLVYPFAVKYPVPELQPRKVDLEFKGPFRADLHLAAVGEGDRDAVTGTYVFSVDWPPVEKAAFEAIRAAWVQDVKALNKVRFDIEPVRFAPCGEECFLAQFRFAAVKVGSKRLTLKCAPEGQASLVLDKETRTFKLTGVKTEPKCEGLLGKLVGLVAPLFAKTYDDLVLFQMPEGLPFTIDRVRSKGGELEISGGLAWRAADAR
jgi:hypothetical protein